MTEEIVRKSGNHLYWYRPNKNYWMWQRYKMPNGGLFQMMRFGFFGVNYYGK